MSFQNVHHFSSVGKREIQQDRVATDLQYLLVADGIGGLSNGDKAAEILVDTIVECFRAKTIKSLPKWIDKAIGLAHVKMQIFSNENMGSTFAMTMTYDESIYAIHLGDSKIVHFSKFGELRWLSTDHTVNNSLTKAVMSSSDVVRPSIHKLDTEPNDYILICSDGVYEACTTNQIGSWVNHYDNCEAIISAIRNQCDKFSVDNNSAIVSKI